MNETTDPTKRSWSGGRLLAVLAVAALVVLIVQRIGDDSDGGDDVSAGTAPSQPAFVEVTYYVGGTTTQADITAQTPTGTDQLAVGVPLKSKDGTPGVTMRFKRGDFVYVSAQNTGAISRQTPGTLGDVTCEIMASDGSVISEATATADYGIATCDGLAR